MDGRIGVVAIGRNEGERLVRCLRSAAPAGGALVYVDSGSSDASVARAAELGASVVELGADRPFTAARARNAGFARLLEIAPDVAFVQFVDGDCELRPDWLEAARDALGAVSGRAAVCGRRRERHPDRSPWNRLVDLEWDTPVGPARAFGGDVMVRCDAFRAVGGYDAGRIAGEDPDLALRLRRAGYTLERLDREMTLHDAALERFGQWWRRAVRGGHAYAEAWLGDGPPAEPETRRRVLSIVAWGGALPGCALLAAPATGGASLALAGLYGVLLARVYRGARARGRAPGDAARQAAGVAMAKGAELQGVALYIWNRLLRGRRTALIEYKGPARPT